MSYHPIYDHQIEYLEAGDLDGLLSQYADDAKLVRFDRTISGKEDLREFFAGYLAAIAPFKLVSTDKYTQTDDAIFFEATVSAGGNEVKVYDVFMLEGGLITHHFPGLK